MSTRIAVIYYSSTGTIHELAAAVAEGAEEVGAAVRLRRVAETAPREAIAQNPQWATFAPTYEAVTEATLEDLDWAEGVAWGTPTRFGNVAAQLKAFMDTTGPLWAQGKLAGKAMSGFTAAKNPHGGQETTLLALANTFYHWGAIIVPVGYTAVQITAAGGNPYGTSATDDDGDGPDEAERAAARYQGERLARIAAHLAAVASV